MHITLQKHIPPSTIETNNLITSWLKKSQVTFMKIIIVIDLDI